MLHSVLEEDEQCVRANGLRRCDGGHEMSDFSDRALGSGIVMAQVSR